MSILFIDDQILFGWGHRGTEYVILCCYSQHNCINEKGRKLKETFIVLTCYCVYANVLFSKVTNMYRKISSSCNIWTCYLILAPLSLNMSPLHAFRTRLYPTSYRETDEIFYNVFYNIYFSIHTFIKHQQNNM